MKKVLLLLLIFSAFAAVPVAAADGLKDNQLQIDDSRLEQERELNFGAQSEQVRGLFNETEQKKLDEMQSIRDKQLATEGGQLFSAIERPAEKPREAALFQSNLQINRKGSAGAQVPSSDRGGLPELVYASLALLLVGMTGVISYRIVTNGQVRKSERL